MPGNVQGTLDIMVVEKRKLFPGREILLQFQIPIHGESVTKITITIRGHS